MQIKFLTIYGSPIHGAGTIEAQYNLLGFWQRSLLNYQVPQLKKAIVEFNDYSFEEYPDQEKLHSEIKRSSCSHPHGMYYWQYAGKRYDLFEELYNDIAKDHRLMELTITVEE